MKPNLRTNLGRFLLGAVLLLAAGTVWAQPQNIRGKITDPAGQPVAGASVIVKGTTNGTSAKADGTFELGAAKGATLQITMLGYKTAEKEVTTATFYPITLEDDSKLVDEVVVVGYGAVKKSDVGHCGVKSRVEYRYHGRIGHNLSARLDSHNIRGIVQRRKLYVFLAAIEHFFVNKHRRLVILRSVNDSVTYGGNFLHA